MGKKVFGFMLACIGLGMLLMSIIPGGLIAIILIICCFFWGYRLFCKC